MFLWDFETTARGHLTKKAKTELHRAQKGRCMYCGRRPGLAYMHADHKKPLARGVSNSKRNFQLICAVCNSRKRSMTDGEFRRKYKLTPSRQAKGPPLKVIPQKQFKEITEQTQVRRRSRRQREEADLLW